MKMNLTQKYLQDHYISKKHFPINNTSTDFTKTVKMVKNNNHHNNTYSNNTKNNLSNKKLFQHIKLYNIIKQNNSKIMKKRNNSYSSMHNNLTEGNLINKNTNNNNYISLFNSNIIKYNPKNYNIYNTNYIHPNKILIKSKSNTNKYHYKNNIIINQVGKNIINNNSNNNNKNLFYTLGLMNNLSMKSIKNYTKKISNSYKKNNNYKLNINKFSENIPKRNTDIEEKIIKYKKQIENYKKEISIKDNTIKSQINKINELNIIIQNTKKKFKIIEKEYNLLKNNYLLLKNKNDQNEQNIKTMNKKEIKLMQVLFLIKEKGVDINYFLNEVNQISLNEYNNNELNIKSLRDSNSANNENDISGMTIYFPDKIKMKNIMDTNWGKNIPKLNFDYVPEYSSENNSDKNEQDNINNENIVFFQNVGKYQHSV